MDAINLYLLQSAEENREAAILLSSGCVAQAMEIFSNAINILDQLRQLHYYTVRLDFDISPTCSSVEVAFLEDEHYFAYKRAIIFHVDIVPPTEHDIDFYRGVVLFNMALATNMRGKALKEEKNLLRAVGLYHQHLRAVSGLPLGDSTTDLLRVAALNNAMIIHVNMGNFTEAKRSLDDVRQHWLHALVFEFTSQAFGKSDIEGFILNTMESMPPTGAAGA